MVVSASYWTVQRRLLGELISCWNGTSAMELPEGEWRVRSQSYGTAQRTDFSRSACTCPQAVLEGSRLGMLQAVKKIVTVLLSPQHHPYKEVSRAISDLSLRRHFQFLHYSFRDTINQHNDQTMDVPPVSRCLISRSSKRFIFPITSLTAILPNMHSVDSANGN